MGSSTTTQTNTIPQAGGQEAGLRQLLASLGQQAGGQFGDLSQLAQGNIGGPTEQDRQLVEQSIGASADIARRELERTLAELQGQLGEQLSSRGIQGSSIEAVQRGQLGARGLDQIANLLSQESAQGGQALMNLPFQRAQTQLGANQTLLQRLTGTGGLGAQLGLQERLAQGTSTQETPFNPMQLLQAGLGAANPLSALGNLIPGGGGQQLQ